MRDTAQPPSTVIGDLDQVAVGVAEVDRRDGAGGVPGSLLPSRDLVFAEWFRARPVADFHLDALGALELYLVGVGCPAEFARARGFETLARLPLVFDRKPDVFETEPLSCRPHR